MAFEITDQIQRHLNEEKVASLTTVSAAGRPVPRPIWFVWDAPEIFLYSLNTAARVKNIRGNREVSLHFNSNADGGDIVTISGTAELIVDGVSLSKNALYVAKYGIDMEQAGFDLETVDRDYATMVRIVPDRVWTAD